MKKTITANISGSVFHIEEDAYEQLNAYLNSIRRKFDGSPDADEIISDIEGRIAELFVEGKGHADQVVTNIDVNRVIQTMGAPEDYVDGEQESSSQHAYAGNRSGASNEQAIRKLYRNPDDRWLGGVMGGIAAYFDTSVTMLRVLLLISIFGLGIPILVYIIAWIVIPKATTNAEKLQMRGEPVTVENIKRMFEDGVDAVERGAKNFADKASNLGKEVRSNKSRNGVDKFFEFLGDVIKYVFKAAAKLFGIFFMLLGGVLIAGLLAMLIFRTGFIWDGVDVFQGGNIREMAGMIFQNLSQAWWMVAALAVATIIPAIWLIVTGIRLVTSRKFGWWPVALIPVWIIAMIVAGVIGGQVGFDFRQESKVRKEVQIEQPVGEVLHLAALPNEYFDDSYGNHDPNRLVIEGNHAFLDFVRIDIEQSPDSLYHLQLTRKAHGSSMKEARARAQNIHFRMEQSENTLSIAPYFSIPTSDRFRAQEQKLVLQVPVGKGVYLDESTLDVIYDIDNVFDTHDRNMVGETWTMTQKGLSNAISPEEVPNTLRPRMIEEPENPSEEYEEGMEGFEEEMEEFEREMEELEEDGPVVDARPSTSVIRFNIPTIFGHIL